jgi:hypothetical protein
MEQAFHHFNDALAQCPLVFADEVMPKDLKGRGKTGELREFIQSDSRPFRRKFVSDGVLRGAARVIIAANNRNLLDGEDSLTAADIKAITDRILHIHCDQKSADYLVETDTSQWVSGQGIIAHALWLRENLERPEPGTSEAPRFLTKSSETGLHQAIPTTTQSGSAVAHWLVSFLLDPKTLRAGQPPGSSAHLVLARDGVLMVNPRALTDHWDRYRTNVRTDRITAKYVAGALRPLSSINGSDQRTKLTVSGFSTRQAFWPISLDILSEWAESTGHSSQEELESALRALEHPP